MKEIAPAPVLSSFEKHTLGVARSMPGLSAEQRAALAAAGSLEWRDRVIASCPECYPATGASCPEAS